MSSKTYQAYLLGLLPEAELAQVEQTLITDGDCYEQVLMAEGDLIDNYLRGRLSSAERQRFDEHFLLTPERQEQFRFMQILHGYVDRTPQVQGQQPSVKSWWERLLPFPVTALVDKNLILSVSNFEAVDEVGGQIERTEPAQ